MSSPRLSIIPAGAVTDRSLEPRDLQALCLLGRHTDKAGWCVRSQVRMSVELGCGRASLQRSLERLVEAGWVEKKRRDAQVAAEGGHVSSSYAYRVVLDRDDYAFENATRESEARPRKAMQKTHPRRGGAHLWAPRLTAPKVPRRMGTRVPMHTRARVPIHTWAPRTLP
jgi:hypothetical protein